MNVQFINCPAWGIDPKIFSVCAKRLERHAPKTDAVLNVVFVSDSYIASLNKAYRKKEGPTDVLSFSYLGTPDVEGAGLAGEVYISMPTARRQAKEHGLILKDELKKLFVHGYLHIVGFDHENDEDYKKMAAAELEALKE